MLLVLQFGALFIYFRVLLVFDRRVCFVAGAAINLSRRGKSLDCILYLVTW